MSAMLNSWKEIAVYVGRGVRTVQRWEQEKHLPVHRIGTSPKAPVFALESELRIWQRQFLGNPAAESAPALSAKRCDSVANSTLNRHRELLTRTSELLNVHQKRCASLLETLNKSEKMLVASARARQLRVASLPPTSHPPSQSQTKFLRLVGGSVWPQDFRRMMAFPIASEVA